MHLLLLFVFDLKLCFVTEYALFRADVRVWLIGLTNLFWCVIITRNGGGKMLAFLLSLTDEDSQKKIETIYSKYHYDMLRFARYSLRKKGASNIESGAEDVVQNAFLKITKSSLNVSNIKT